MDPIQSPETSTETTQSPPSQSTAPDTTQTLTAPTPDLSTQTQTPPLDQTQTQTQPDPNAPPADATKPGDEQAATLNEKWNAEDLDDELKAFIGNKTPEQIAKDAMNAQKLIGKKSVGIPGPNSTPEEQRAFHKARGVPDEATGYDLAPTLDKLKDNMPAGWAPDEKMETAFKEAARLSNMSQTEASRFAEVWLGKQFEMRKEVMETQVKASTEARALMSSTWGPNTEQETANFGRGMKAIGLDGAGVDVLLDALAGDGKARFGAVQAIANIGRNFAEDGPTPGLNPNRSGTAMSKEQARAEMERIKADPVLSDAWTNPVNARHGEIRAEMIRLGKIERGV